MKPGKRSLGRRYRGEKYLLPEQYGHGQPSADHFDASPWKLGLHRLGEKRGKAHLPSFTQLASKCFSLNNVGRSCHSFDALPVEVGPPTNTDGQKPLSLSSTHLRQN